MKMAKPATIALAILGVVVSSTALAQESERTISVSGRGAATAPPDMATIHTGVVTVAQSATAALESNNAGMQQLITALEEHEIAAKDIQTTSFYVQPEYRRDRQGRTTAEIAGYRVTNQVRVRVRNLPTLGVVLDSLVQAGSNQISGISFGIDDPTGILNQARNRAVADARSRAMLYAQAAGVAVGRVLKISEQATYSPQPQFFAGAEAMGEVPVATGEQEIQATVLIVFQLQDE